LFHKDRVRAALVNEVEHGWEEVAIVFGSLTESGGREGLARRRACPHWQIVRPSDVSESVRPSANTCEQMHLAEVSQIIRYDIFDRSLIYFSRSY